MASTPPASDLVSLRGESSRMRITPETADELDRKSGHRPTAEARMKARWFDKPGGGRYKEAPGWEKDVAAAVQVSGSDEKEGGREFRIQDAADR